MVNQPYSNATSFIQAWRHLGDLIASRSSATAPLHFPFTMIKNLRSIFFLYRYFSISSLIPYTSTSLGFCSFFYWWLSLDNLIRASYMSSSIAERFLLPRPSSIPTQLCTRNVQTKRAKSTAHFILDHQGILRLCIKCKKSHVK